ncbi:MAG: T9SS type A sorting domain-containing protein [Bacteroidales bacterium]|nr:T9SS type A sorting domain-containing protein [Bacteroidales bacterium]
MNRFHILIINFFFFSGYLFAQQTFEKIITEPEDQVINSVIEDNDGNYFLAGRFNNIEATRNNGYIIKLDSSGNLIQQKIISSDDNISSLFFNIHLFNNHLYILGTQVITYPDTSKLWYLKLNSNLEIENEKFLAIPHDRWFSYMNSIIDSDNNFVITGYTSRMDDVYNYNHDAFFYKLNINGDSLNSKFYTSNIPLYFSFDIIESPDSSKYYAFVSHFESSSGGQKLILNKNFDSLSINPIPLGIYDYYSPITINENEILLCGKGSPDQSELYALNVISINEQTELIDYNSFRKQSGMREHPSMFNGVSKNGNNIYIGGTSNLDYSNPFWSTFNAWFHLVKINHDITTIWEYWYGGDAYYFLYNIHATNDGGCLMVGNRYDDDTQDQERDIYVVKVDSSGLITWTQEILTDKPETKVYPNPGTNQLNIKTTSNEIDFELLNINGQVVVREMLDGNNSIINVESIKTGIYFYRLIDDKYKTVETGKWIKL